MCKNADLLIKISILTGGLERGQQQQQNVFLNDLSSNQDIAQYTKIQMRSQLVIKKSNQNSKHWEISQRS